MLTVEYERARGKRAVGQTSGVGFEVGVQRTLPASASALWKVLVTRPGLWLAEGARVRKGARFDGDGVRGEIRVVRTRERLRLTWQPEAWKSPATLQVTLLPRGPRSTSLHVHLEKLPSARARTRMRTMWRERTDAIAAELAPAPGPRPAARRRQG
jgi:uncharacterized protein YndB with AHSA1/START domain